MSTKARVIAALIVGVGLIAVYVATEQEPKRMAALSERELPSMPDLTKIEIQTAAESTGPEGMGEYSGPLLPTQPPVPKIVLERRGSQWWVTSPFEAPASKRYTDRIQSVFSQAHGTDKIPVEQGRLTEQGLSDALRTTVTFHREDPNSAPLTLHVGKEIVLPPMKIRRTFVQWPGDPKVYKLQATLGFLRHRNPLSMRSMVMASIKPEDVTRLRFEYPSTPGKSPIEVQREGDGWAFVEPTMSVKPDTGTLNFVLSALNPLSASGMLPDTTPTAFKPTADTVLKVTTKGAQEPLVLHVRKVPQEIELKSWFEGTLDQREEVFQMTRQRGMQLTPDMGRLRDLRVNPFDPATITRFVTPDRTRQHMLTFEKSEGTWRMTAPVQAPVSSSPVIDAMIHELATMKVGRYATDSERQRLGDAPQAIQMSGPQGTHTLLIGDLIEGSKEVFVSRYKDVEPMFVVTTYMMRSFLPKIQSVVDAKTAQAILGE